MHIGRVFGEQNEKKKKLQGVFVEAKKESMIDGSTMCVTRFDVLKQVKLNLI